MRNFKLTIEYDGVGFCGWQVQAHGERTVQGELEAVISKVFKAKIKCIASGRTDSGVHAAGQVAHCKADTRMRSSEIQKAFNSLLPKDIAVLKVREVKEDFHAQYSAKGKTYVYTVLNRDHRSAFLRDRAYFYPAPLNIFLMRKAARVLVGRHDFKSFQAHDPLRADRNSVRTVKRLLIQQEGDLVRVEVTANGFLYKMVRNIAGTLLAVGSGRLPVEEVQRILKARDRGKARETAPAHGLCLMKVKY